MINSEPINGEILNGEASAFNLGHLRASSEAVTVETDSHDRGWVVTATADLTLFDQWVKTVIPGGGAGGTIYTEVRGETVVVGDGLMQWVFRRRELAEAFSILDNLAQARQRVSQLTENLLTTDGFISWARRYRLSTEQLVTLEDLVTWRHRFVVSGDFATLIDQIIAFSGRLNTILASEAITVEDGGRRLEWAVTAEGTITVIDSFIKSLLTGGGITTVVTSENVAITDGQIHWVLRRRDVTEILELVESSSDLRATATEDAIAMFDEFLKTVIRPGGITTSVIGNNLTITDDAGQSWTYRRRDLTDALSVVDQVLAFRRVNREMTEAIETTDELRFWRRLVRANGEVVTLIEGLLTSLQSAGATYIRIASELLEVQDNSGRSVLRQKLTTEGVDLTDQQLRWVMRIRELSESVEYLEGTVNIRMTRKMIAELLEIPDERIASVIYAVMYDVRIRIGVALGAVVSFVRDIVLGWRPSDIQLGAYA